VSPPRQVRILVRVHGEDRKFAKLAFVEARSCVYVTPYAVRGATYYYSEHEWQPGEDTKTFTFTDQHRSSTPPHLSIHEDGRTHVRNGGQAGPIFLPPLERLRGEHIASVTCGRFRVLPRLDGPLRLSGRRRDRVVPVPLRVDAGRISLFANAERPEFKGPCRMRFELATRGTPLHIGVAVHWQDPLTEVEDFEALVVIAGWDPFTGGNPAFRTSMLTIVARLGGGTSSSSGSGPGYTIHHPKGHRPTGAGRE
jgi:hypothetical protein